MKRIEPSVNILYRTAETYAPSWRTVPRSIVVPRLNGHFGLVGPWRDQLVRNERAQTHANATDMKGGNQ